MGQAHVRFIPFKTISAGLIAHWQVIEYSKISLLVDLSAVSEAPTSEGIRSDALGTGASDTGT
jgi:hypothetical protein